MDAVYSRKGSSKAAYCRYFQRDAHKAHGETKGVKTLPASVLKCHKGISLNNCSLVILPMHALTSVSSQSISRQTRSASHQLVASVYMSGGKKTAHQMKSPQWNGEEAAWKTQTELAGRRNFQNEGEAASSAIIHLQKETALASVKAGSWKGPECLIGILIAPNWNMSWVIRPQISEKPAIGFLLHIK